LICVLKWVKIYYFKNGMTTKNIVKPVELLGKPLKIETNQNQIRFLSFVWIIVLVFCTETSFSSVTQQVFYSQGVSAKINDSSGRLISVTNRLTGVTYSINSDRIRISTGEGNIDLSKIVTKRTISTKTTSTFTGKSTELEFFWTYNFPENRTYFDRNLIVKNISNHSILLKSVSDGELAFNAPFQSVSFHDDNMSGADSGSEKYTETGFPVLYQTAVNVFMRDRKGGICAGLEYPYFKPTLTRKSMRFTYELNYLLTSGETLELPTMFFGTFEKTGYKIQKKLDWTPRILSTKQEVMDLGEVRAMQQIMGDYLTEEPLPVPGYFILLNSWWAKRELQGKMGPVQADAYCKLADNVEQSRCIDMMALAAPWVGWCEFIQPCPEIDAVGEDAVFPMNPAIRKVVSYTDSIHLPMASFCEPNALVRHYRNDRPDWKVQPDLNSPKVLIQNCHANIVYEDWFYNLICNAIDSGKLSGWAWDFHWMRRPAFCYGKTHGHAPGNVEFQQYRNVTRLIQKLRNKYPNNLLEIYWGLKEAGPWALRWLNTQENNYENNSPPPPGMTAADDLRFQHWYNHNYRFIPTYLNLAQINFKEGNGHLYSILSSLSASTHASLTDWIPFENQSEADTVFALIRQWKAWATRNLDYLKDRVDLFGQPCRKNGIDGTAHIKGNKGFIFVFNPTSKPGQGIIPLTKLIGLTSGSRFQLSDISSGKSIPIGVYKKGDDFLFPIAAKSAIAIELESTTRQTDRPKVVMNSNVQYAFSK
jgi:hypothetical protein